MRGVAEELEGNGKVIQDGLEMGEVSYSIRVYREGPKGWLYPYAKFRQRGSLQLWDLVNKPITLILEDGRHWECCLKSLDGTVIAVGAWPAREVTSNPT